MELPNTADLLEDQPLEEYPSELDQIPSLDENNLVVADEEEDEKILGGDNNNNNNNNSNNNNTSPIVTHTQVRINEWRSSFLFINQPIIIQIEERRHWDQLFCHSWARTGTNSGGRTCREAPGTGFRRL